MQHTPAAAGRGDAKNALASATSCHEERTELATPAQLGDVGSCKVNPVARVARQSAPHLILEAVSTMVVGGDPGERSCVCDDCTCHVRNSNINHYIKTHWPQEQLTTVGGNSTAAFAGQNNLHNHAGQPKDNNPPLSSIGQSPSRASYGETITATDQRLIRRRPETTDTKARSTLPFKYKAEFLLHVLADYCSFPLAKRHQVMSSTSMVCSALGFLHCTCSADGHLSRPRGPCHAARLFTYLVHHLSAPEFESAPAIDDSMVSGTCSALPKLPSASSK